MMQAREYNCCTRGRLPDMAQFTHLEINAVYPYSDGTTETCCEALFGVASGKLSIVELLDESEDNTLVFFTVYGRSKEGLAEALHDADSLSDAVHIAAEINRHYQHLDETVLN